MLTLPEQLTILSTDDRGRAQFSVPNLLNSALVGAALLELHWQGAVSVTAQQVTVLDRAPLGNGPLSFVAAALADAPEPLPAATWTRLSRSPLPGLRALVQLALAQKGLFLRRPCRKLFLFPSTYLAPEPAARERTVGQMRTVLLGPRPDDLREQALGALVDASGIIYRAFRAIEDLRPAKERAGELAQALTGAAADEAVRLVLQGVYAARIADAETSPSMA